MEPVQVQARGKRGGGFEPLRIVWNGTEYRVESTGRSWEDEHGLHVLVMIRGGRVFELVFHLNPAGWLLRPVSGNSAAA